ncbi:hypothetical protein HPP92_026825 [Vanilla planifolia]|uniref:Protein SDA1 n=1 Tax=Vanilla planifolia TaxID=51239 RepID=A0A835PFR9_VANPL|nr:hypothetical protein HPP92_026825 [Vanilla planifolia]
MESEASSDEDDEYIQNPQIVLSREDAIAVGLNVVREMCLRMPLLMNEGLLQDLVLRTSRSKLSKQERVALIRAGRGDREKYKAKTVVKQKKQQKQHSKATSLATKITRASHSRQEKKEAKATWNTQKDMRWSFSLSTATSNHPYITSFSNPCSVRRRTWWSRRISASLHSNLAQANILLVNKKLDPENIDALVALEILKLQTNEVTFDPSKLVHVRSKLSKQERVALVRAGRGDRENENDGLSKRKRDLSKAMPLAPKRARAVRSRQEKKTGKASCL